MATAQVNDNSNKIRSLHYKEKHVYIKGSLLRQKVHSRILFLTFYTQHFVLGQLILSSGNIACSEMSTWIGLIDKLGPHEETIWSESGLQAKA